MNQVTPTTPLAPEELAELKRVARGEPYDEAFWHRRWKAAAPQSSTSQDIVRELQGVVSDLREETSRFPEELSSERIALERRLRKASAKLRKARAAKKRASRLASISGYASSWTPGQRRADNLRSAAIHISRAVAGEHFNS